MSDHSSSVPLDGPKAVRPKPFVVIDPYQFDGDVAFGVWDADHGHYQLGDGDCYSVDALEKHWPNAVQVSWTEVEARFKRSVASSAEVVVNRLPSPMLLGLDYDATYTRDPDFWDAVIALGLQRGHQFVCVTSRDYAPGSTKPERVPSPAIPVLCAGHALKDDAARAAGYKVSIWIDDTPSSISQTPESVDDGS